MILFGHGQNFSQNYVEWEYYALFTCSTFTREQKWTQTVDPCEILNCSQFSI